MPNTHVSLADDPADPAACRVVLRGRVRVPDVAALHRVALAAAAKPGRVTVDCSGAEYLDAAALQVVLALGRDVVARGRKCEVAGVAGPLAETLRLIGAGDGT